jgi:hypothetical protein
VPWSTPIPAVIPHLAAMSRFQLSGLLQRIGSFHRTKNV